MKKSKKSSFSSGWNNVKWVESRIDQTVSNLFIQKFLNIHHIKKHRFDLIQDLYAELIQDIFSGKKKLKLLPNESTLLEMLRKKFLTIKSKEDRMDEKFQQMGRDLQDE